MKNPKSWSDITVSQFIEIRAMENNNEIEFLSILFDMPLQQLNEMDVITFNKYLEDSSFINTPISQKTKNSITISDIQFHKIDFYKMTIGEFIDLEHYFTNNYYLNLDKILAIVYRRKITSENVLLFEDTFEPYDNFIGVRSKLFNQASINDVNGIISEYLIFRKRIFDVYSGLFNTDEDYDDNEDDIENDDKDVNSKKDNPSNESKAIKWGWDLILYKLAQTNPLDIERATNIPLIQGLNILAMMKEMNLN